MGFPWQVYWSGLPFPSPGDLPIPGIKPRSPALQADTLPSEPAGNLEGPQIFSPNAFQRFTWRGHCPQKDKGQERKLQEREMREGSHDKVASLSMRTGRVLGPKLQSCSHGGPANYKVLFCQWVRAASWGFMGHAKQACSKWLKSACWAIFKVIGYVKYWVWQPWNFELTDPSQQWRNKQPRGAKPRGT